MPGDSLAILFAFKYISCYSLSIFGGKDERSQDHLNTSHVILYQNRHLLVHITAIFKYISCYSLSEKDGLPPVGSCHLNTSHVILYLSPRIKSAFCNRI